MRTTYQLPPTPPHADRHRPAVLPPAPCGEWALVRDRLAGREGLTGPHSLLLVGGLPVPRSHALPHGCGRWRLYAQVQSRALSSAAAPFGGHAAALKQQGAPALRASRLAVRAMASGATGPVTKKVRRALHARTGRVVVLFLCAWAACLHMHAVQCPLNTRCAQCQAGQEGIGGVAEEEATAESFLCLLTPRSRPPLQ